MQWPGALKAEQGGKAEEDEECWPRAEETSVLGSQTVRHQPFNLLEIFPGRNPTGQYLSESGYLVTYGKAHVSENTTQNTFAVL